MLFITKMATVRYLEFSKNAKFQLLARLIVTIGIMVKN